MNTAVVDDDVAINLDGRAIVGPRGERVLAIAIGPKPTAPFDAELLLRQRRRIRVTKSRLICRSTRTRAGSLLQRGLV